MADLIPINIVLADRSYRIRIEHAEVEVERKSASLIKDKKAEYRQKLAGKDMQDYVAMVLLWFATEQNTSTIHELKWKEAAEKINSLEKLIDKALI